MGQIVNDAVMEPGLDPKDRGGYPGFNPRQETLDGLLIDYDVAVKLRDGVDDPCGCLSSRQR